MCVARVLIILKQEDKNAKTDESLEFKIRAKITKGGLHYLKVSKRIYMYVAGKIRS